MSVISSAFGVELTKIFWRVKYWVLLAVYAAAGLAVGVAGASGYSLRTVTDLTFTVTGPNVVYGVLSAYRSLLIPLAVFMLCADVFTSELESKSIKCVITRPVSRFDAYLAKSLAILCYVAISLGVGFAASQAWQVFAAVSASVSGASTATATATAATASAAISSAAASPSPLLLQISQFAEALFSYALTLVPMAAFVAFASVPAVLVRSPALVMFLCIVSYIALSTVGTMYNGAGAALFTTYTSWYRMWIGERLPLRSVVSAAGLLLSTTVALFCVGFFIFDKKDI